MIGDIRLAVEVLAVLSFSDIDAIVAILVHHAVHKIVSLRSVVVTMHE